MTDEEKPSMTPVDGGNTDESTASDAGSDASDDPTTGTNSEPDTSANADPEADGGRTEATPSEPSSGTRFRTAVNYLALAGLGLTLLVAGIQFYASVTASIDRFVAREFQPLVRAVFNLALVVLAAAGISIQLRRIT